MLFLSLLKPGYYLKQQFFSLTETPSKAPVPVLYDNCIYVYCVTAQGCLESVSLQVHFISTKGKSRAKLRNARLSKYYCQAIARPIKT